MVAGLLGLGVWGGCGTATKTETHGSSSQALAPDLSAPLDVEPDPSADAKEAWGMHVACGPEQCLSAYAVSADLDEYSSAASALVALRVDRSGKWHQTAPTILSRSDQPGLPSLGANWVVPQGKDFLVGSIVQIDSAVGYVHRVFADGTSELVAEGEQWRNRPLCVTADRSVFWAGGAVRMYAADFSPVGPAVAISATDGVVGSSTCLAYSTAEAVRLRLSDGATLDSPPLVPTKYQFGWRLSGGYKAGNFVLFWQNDDGLYSSRIRESDGFLLDPDDTFNQKPGAQLIATTIGNGEIQTFDWGNQLFVTWWELHNNSNVVVGARVNPTTGLRVSGSTNSYESAVGSESLGYPIYLTPSSGLLAWRLLGRPVSVADGSPPVFTPSDSAPLAYELPSRKRPTVAATPTQFVVAWDADGQVRATRVDVTTGAYLDAPSLQLGAGTNPAAAAAGPNGYLITWLDGTNLRRRFVNHDGTLGQSLAPLDIGAGVQPHSTKLAFDGDRFVFSWLSATVLRAIRLGGSAEPLDATPLSIATKVNYYDVTADTAPAPDRRSFAFSYRVVSGDEKARLLRSQSGVLVQPELTLGTPPSWEGSLPAAASDGTKIALSFWSTSQGSMARGYLDSVGVAFAPSTFQDVGAVRTGKLWFDGKSYLLLESKAEAGSLGVRRFEPTLAPVDSAKAGSGQLLEAVFAPYALVQVAAASNGAGKSLVAYPQLDPARLGGTIKVRLIDNDGSKDPNASGGAGGDGLGGAADSGGTGGINGGTGGINGGTGGLSGGTGGLDAGTGGLDDGTGGLDGEAGSSGEGGLNAGGTSTSEGGMPQTGGTGTGGDVSTGGSSLGGTGQGGADAEVGGGGTGGTPGAGGAVQAGASGVSAQAGSGAVSGTAGSSSSAGAASGANDAPTDGGCGCRVVAPSKNGGHIALMALAVLGAALRRVRKRQARRSGSTGGPRLDMT
jgi:MYXO-CTERM domain-containing protein